MQYSNLTFWCSGLFFLFFVFYNFSLFRLLSQFCPPKHRLLRLQQ